VRVGRLAEIVQDLNFVPPAQPDAEFRVVEHSNSGGVTPRRLRDLSVALRYRGTQEYSEVFMVLPPITAWKMAAVSRYG
jgi:hypothetical protein